MLTFATHVLLNDASSTQAEKKLLVTSKWQQWMKKFFWREDCAIHQALHLKAGIYVFARVTHVYDRMTDRKLVILADKWIQTYDIAILNRLILIYLMMKAQGLVPAPLSASLVLKGLCFTMG